MGGRLVCVGVTFLMVTGMTNHAEIASNLVLLCLLTLLHMLNAHAYYSTPSWTFLTLMYTKRCDTADDAASGGGYHVGL